MFKRIISLFLLILSFHSQVRGFVYDSLTKGWFCPIHVLIVDPQEHLILPVKASGRETVLSLAKRYGAVAAVNAGFWKANGDPAGILKISHKWYGTPLKPRGAIGWSIKSRKVLIDRVLTNYQLNDCPNQCEIEIIPVSNPSPTSSEEWKELEHIVGGTPVLVRDGKLIEDYSPEQTLESFLVSRFPRTAVGIRESGEWVFVVCDSRFYGLFRGMTIRELAELMLELGCVEALNLCGGSSSTMIIEGTAINDPFGEIQEDGKHVQAVSDAILIF